MSQLKIVTMRLKSIKNIQKITKTMKMVSASKFTRAERELRAARPFGYAPRKFYQSSALAEGLLTEEKDKNKDPGNKAEPAPPPPPTPPPVDAKDAAATGPLKKIYIAVTSDRGLCGGVHSGICRRIRNRLNEQSDKDPERTRLVCVGDKSRTILRRLFSANILISAKEIGRTPPVFADAAGVAGAVADAKYDYDIGDIYYNKFVSAVKYELTIVPFFSKQKVEEAPTLSTFDDIEPDDMESYTEWTLAALLYYAMKESAASEQSARMAAMDNATKNASDMIGKLTLLFNRTRQAVITRELIEIISGAAALK